MGKLHWLVALHYSDVPLDPGPKSSSQDIVRHQISDHESRLAVAVRTSLTPDSFILHQAF